MRVNLTRLVQVCAVTVYFIAPCQAQPVRATEIPAISLVEAIAGALEHNPELVAFDFQIDVFEGRIRQAGFGPNPELTIALEDGPGTGVNTGFGNAETTISLAWVFERDVRERRVDAVRARASLSTVDAEILRVDVAAETARRYLDALAYQARADTASAAVRLAVASIDAIRQRVDAGRAPPADLARAQAELATAKLALEDVDHEQRAARYRLAAQWGETEPQFLAVTGDAFALPEPDSLEVLRHRVADNPDLARYFTTQRVHEAELVLAKAERRQPLAARFGLRRSESTNDYSLVAGVSIPLTLRNRNQGRIAEVQAEIGKNQAEADAQTVRIETALVVLYEALQHSLHRATVLRNDVLPSLETALNATNAAYEVGRYSYLEWHAAQAAQISAQNELINACIDAKRFVIEIERLTGVGVARPVPQH